MLKKLSKDYHNLLKIYKVLKNSRRTNAILYKRRTSIFFQNFIKFSKDWDNLLKAFFAKLIILAIKNN